MTRKPTTCQQIEVLRHLSQQAASKFLDRPAAWLRDHSHEIPRNSDGSYSAASLLKWQINRPPDVTLSDDQQEMLLQAAEVSADMGDSCFAVRTLLIELRDNYGSAGLTEFAIALLNELNSNPPSEPTETAIIQDLAAQVNRDRVWKLLELHVAKLEAVHQCDHCARVRRGSKWLKPGKQYPAEAIVSDECPDCSAKSQRRKSRR